MNCDRDTPWLPKEDLNDEKVYSKEGASRTHARNGWGDGQWKHACSVLGWVKTEAGVTFGLLGMVDSNSHSWGTWVTQSVKHPTLDFGSSHDLEIVRSSPVSSSLLGLELV